nr:MAG TPA: hypothetical protein [Caudoviricetes sp.]
MIVRVKLKRYLTELPRGSDKTRGSDLVKQFVSKLLRIC